jgi:predicted TPR repeat methyltransferase
MSVLPPSGSLSAADVVRLLPMAVDLQRAGRLAEAERIYQAVLAAQPDNFDALHFLGVLCHQRKDGARGAALVRRALALRPDQAGAHNNLGNILRVSGDLPGAIAAYRQAVALAPTDADAHENLARACREAGDEEAAALASHQALLLRPRAAAESYHRVGAALYAFGRLAEAAAIYEKWLTVEPEHPVPRHLLAACRGQEIPARASDDFVARTFDGFAATFDETLARLEYRAPALVAEAARAALPAGAAGLDVLDAGCGTGLCGPLLRAQAARLVGVDLSPGMLDVARGRAVYDALEAAELTVWLEAHPRAYNLVVSADTLVYFGALERVLAAAAGALRPGGRLVFTVEEAAEEAAPGGHRLHPHGRYAHTRRYVEGALGAAGLATIAIAAAELRKENLAPVRGLVVSARAG